MAKVNHIALGAGMFVVNHGYYKGSRAIFIEPVTKPGPFLGADASDAGLAKDALVDGATVITFPESICAAVLHEAIAKAALLPERDERETMSANRAALALTAGET